MVKKREYARRRPGAQPTERTELNQLLDEVAELELFIHIPWRTNAPHYSGSERDSEAEGPTGFELAGFKDWEPGDRIDIKATARDGWQQLLAAKFFEGRELEIMAFCQKSGTMPFGIIKQTKERLAATLLGAILSTAAGTSDHAGYGIWSPDGHLFRPAQPAKQQLLPALDNFLDADCAMDEPEPGLTPLVERLPRDRRCLVFVISDCLDLTPTDKEALSQAAGKHDMIMIVVGDKRERELPEKGWGPRDIEDLTTGRVMTIWLSNKTRAEWRAQFDKQRQVLRQSLSEIGISMVEAYTHWEKDELIDTLEPIFSGDRP